MEINPVKGTHDIFGVDADLYQAMERTLSETAMLSNYHEIRIPILEYTNLFSRSSGEDSDVVSKEMYTFLDKGNRSVTLRPEFTAGIMRTIVSNKLYSQKEFPLRYFYYGPCFRYERPQAGRYRQFHQFGVEMLGASLPYHDAEAILLAKNMLRAINLDDVTIKINSLGSYESRQNYKEALKNYFNAHIENMCGDCKRRYELNPLRILDCKVPNDKPFIDEAPKIIDFLTKEDREHLDKVREILSSLGVNTVLDPNLVRGLDYYSGVVFEIVSNYEEAPDFGALGGGGHYQNLLEELGGPSYEGVGFSFGLERLVNLYKIVAFDHTPFLNSVDYYVVSLNQDDLEHNFVLANNLRNHGFIVDMNYEIKSIKSIMKYASKIDAKYALIVGEEERENGKVSLKNLYNGQQISVDEEEFIHKANIFIKEYIEIRFKDEDIFDEDDEGEMN